MFFCCQHCRAPVAAIGCLRMAYLWKALREEINGTIDDFREKGAWGAFKDATLDAVDLIQDAGHATNILVSGFKGKIFHSEQ